MIALPAEWTEKLEEDDLAQLKNSTVITGLAYIPNQAIIIGSLDAIGATATDINVDFERVEILSLNLEDEEKIISLVSTSEFGSELDFIEQFNQAAAGRYGTVAQGAPVAEPNYVIREPDGSAPGSPGSSGVLGDPAARPFVPGKIDTGAFVSQWAFEHIELKAAGNRGEGVKIIVFDSSPLPTGYHMVQSGYTQDSSPYSLCVWGAESESETPIMDSHGLFIANLAHAVAPDSAIHLVRVLEYDEASGLVHGSLFSVLNALYVYLESDLRSYHETGRLDPLTVVNLSLGFAENLTHLKPTIESVRDVWGSGGPEDFIVVSLETLLSRYDRPGVVFVAAAGNDGRDFPQPPAIYPWVIGVAATNRNDDLACFSNGGDVSAPGGDGDGECRIDLESSCQYYPDDCDYSVMSVVMTEDGTAAYAHWAGTSFSTPLVSGISALALSEETCTSAECMLGLFCADLAERPADSPFRCGLATLTEIELIP